ncbi:MAG: hypothetical protein LBN07_00345, partial [Christensenellaceae bacterium]|nr:hypothetical protein [Christensenellaceae bacterium]
MKKLLSSIICLCFMFVMGGALSACEGPTPAPKVYAESIEIISDYTIKLYEEEIKTVFMRSDQDSYELTWKVLPEETSDKSVTASWNENTQHKIEQISNTGLLVVFNGSGNLVISLKTNDGSNVITKIYFVPVYATSIEITSNHNVQLGGEITKIIKLSSGEDRYELTWRVL